MNSSGGEIWAHSRSSVEVDHIVACQQVVVLRYVEK
jgi:hypothetical protein